jgi:hypothetical protein
MSIPRRWIAVSGARRTSGARATRSAAAPATATAFAPRRLENPAPEAVILADATAAAMTSGGSGRHLASSPGVRVKTLIAAAGLAIAVATPALCETQPSTVSQGFVAPQANVFGLRRNIGGRGLALRQPITTQSALALMASTGNRKELPEVRVLLGLQYLF